MKKMIVALVAMFSISALAETVTVTICDGGESGTECRTVTYVVREHKDVAAPYEACTQEGTPCTPSEYGVPAWLQKLNDMFGNRGPATQPEAP